MKVKINLYVFLLLSVLVITFLLYTSIESKDVNTIIEVEAEDAIEIVAPMRIINIDDGSGNKALVSMGDNRNHEGYGLYEINIKETGDYYFWGRCYWENACSNSFSLSFDDQGRRIFGQNSVFQKWHWLDFFNKNYLTKGKHHLAIWNFEPRSQLDKFIITGDKYFRPADNKMEEEFFIDFEDGIPSIFIEKTSDKLNLITNNNRNKLLLKSDENRKDSKNEICFIKKNETEAYIFRIALQLADSSDKNYHFQLYNNYINDSNYCCLNVINDSINFVEVEKGIKTIEKWLIKEFGIIQSEGLVSLSIAQFNKKLIFKLDGKTIYSLDKDNSKNGLLGICAVKNQFLIDHIDYYSDNIPHYKSGFHVTEVSLIEELPEHFLNYYKQNRKGKNIWYQMSGVWEYIYDNNEYLVEVLQAKVGDQNQALAAIGDEFWTNYTFSSVFNTSDNKDVGLCFYIQDDQNYCMFRWKQNDKNKSVVQLLSIEDGKQTIIKQKEWESYLTNCWYKLKVKVNNKYAELFIDDQRVFGDSLRYKYDDGKVGLWTASKSETYFDDILISPSKDIDIKIANKRFQYNFIQNQSISTNYSGWIFSDKYAIKHFGWERIFEPYWNKRFCEEVYLIHKKMIDSNFMILTKEDSPKDVHMVFIFKAFKNDVSHMYKLVIEQDRLVFLDDNKVVSRNENFKKGTKLKISHQDGLWEVNSKINDLIDYESDNLYDSIKIIYGYEGIGKAKIDLCPIIIEEIKN